MTPEIAAATVAGEELRTIMAAINRARVRDVGILATDPRDVVFLNRVIRSQCPNVRVFTSETSLALTHPDDAYHLRGMVIGSTYPLAEQRGGPRCCQSTREPIGGRAGPEASD